MRVSEEERSVRDYGFCGRKATLQLQAHGKRVLSTIECGPHIFLVFFRGALRSQKPYGLLGTGEQWDRE